MAIDVGSVRAAVIALGLMALAFTATGAGARGPQSVAALAAELSPAVVNISTRRVTGGGGVPYPEFPEGSPLEDLFDDLHPEHEEQFAPQEARSLGSGFIISPDGIVVTNNHVIAGADEIDVYLTDGRRLRAQIVGTDDKTDLAVLKVPGVELPFVAFGDSDTAEVGDWVMAIGNPFGLGGSVTLGIVSARNRDIQSGPYDQFIQTDASINQGNSGGPLFDMDGQVVGINTALIARGGSSLGIGFAVPVNLARPILDQLVEFGETRRGWLGVGIQEVSEDIAASLGLPGTEGAMVIDVMPGGPAEGIVREGDIILRFDGRSIQRMRDLPRVVAETGVGKAAPVEVLRGGETLTLSVTVGRLEAEGQLLADVAPEPPPVSSGDMELPPPGLSELVGFEIGPLDPEVRAEFGIAEDIQGAIITSVSDGTEAYLKGLLPGLVVTEVNQKKVDSVEAITKLVEEARALGRPAVLFKFAEPTGTSRYETVRLG